MEALQNCKPQAETADLGFRRRCPAPGGMPESGDAFSPSRFQKKTKTQNVRTENSEWVEMNKKNKKLTGKGAESTRRSDKRVNAL
jgi:hypothetical protein